jgi:starch synthase
MVASEATPWAKTGGLADVVAALPTALGSLGHRVTTILPKYRGVRADVGVRLERRVRVGPTEYTVGCETVDLAPRRRAVFIDYPPYFDRDGIYGVGGRDYADSAQRYALLATAALDVAAADIASWPADVIHAHDWQGGLAPALLALTPGRWPALLQSARVFTIHNLAYQGLFPRDVVPAVGLPWRAFDIGGGEFWGQFSYLKAGINYADRITTVSPRYAEEILTPAFGVGMEGVLQARRHRFQGILNGIDTAVWDPETDPHLPAHFGPGDLAGKRVCKRALLERVGLPVGDDALERPLIGLVSRLVAQKGLDLVEGAATALMALDAAWVFVGSGEPRFEEFLKRLAAAHPSRVAAVIGFDESLAHLVEAGSDMFLMPSHFEPCGLNQMYSLRYGTVPIVRAVGGLDDTIQPYTSRAVKANGFKFHDATPDALARTVRQAVRLYRDKERWHPLIEQGMAEDHSWARSAREYVKVYRRARLDAAARSGLTS